MNENLVWIIFGLVVFVITAVFGFVKRNNAAKTDNNPSSRSVFKKLVLFQLPKQKNSNSERVEAVIDDSGD